MVAPSSLLLEILSAIASARHFRKRTFASTEPARAFQTLSSSRIALNAAMIVMNACAPRENKGKSAQFLYNVSHAPRQQRLVRVNDHGVPFRKCTSICRNPFQFLLICRRPYVQRRIRYANTRDGK